VTGRKVYLQSKERILNSIHDIVELLNGKHANTGAKDGIIGARLSMYGHRWEMLFCVKDIGENCCIVAVEIRGERSDRRKEIKSAFALLDYMLVIGAEIEFDENEL